ncbi:DUF998 domain-containing protein [Chryseolinea soli]|uniref:DUF998 domain-containing protein n=1 Tax=Chryseolinea soli TaxID=2321403 RepID=A0A385SUF1_9BACT|nr:DUF998 domain-containing protein [Chryseolinea soli]AYB33605.1 DUF998 domain-containing protein [Chryseolinea soli]
MTPTNWSIVLLGYAKWFALAFMVILTGLHFIKPELDPSWNFISEYEVGKLGWLMQLAFISLGLSCLLFAMGMWTELNILGKIGAGLLLVTAGGMFIGGIFKTDALNTSQEALTMSGRLHQFGAMLDQLPFASLLITIALFKRNNWKADRWLLIVLLAAVWFGFVYFVRAIQVQFPADGKFGPHVVVGWQNRLMIITQALWVALIAFRAQQRTNTSVATPLKSI